MKVTYSEVPGIGTRRCSECLTTAVPPKAGAHAGAGPRRWPACWRAAAETKVSRAVGLVLLSQWNQRLLTFYKQLGHSCVFWLKALPRIGLARPGSCRLPAPPRPRWAHASWDHSMLHVLQPLHSGCLFKPHHDPVIRLYIYFPIARTQPRSYVLLLVRA